METVCKVRLFFFLFSNTGGWNQTLSLLGKNTTTDPKFQYFLTSFICSLTISCMYAMCSDYAPLQLYFIFLPAKPFLSLCIFFCFVTILSSLSSFWPWFEATGCVTDGYVSSVLTISTPNVLRITLLGGGGEQEERMEGEL